MADGESVRRRHQSTSSIASTGSLSLHAPVPRRHANLLQSPTQDWLRSISPPPQSQRYSPSASSMTSTQYIPPSPTTTHRSVSRSPSPVPPTVRNKTPVSLRQTTTSFSALMDHERRLQQRALVRAKATKVRHEARIETRANGDGSVHVASSSTRRKTGAKQLVAWMYQSGLRNWVMPVVILSAVWVKWCVGLGSYSGFDNPPMYGDYEAQRHWMELTLHLPLERWYTYDLPYWGLDYPPLTAYVSWLCGFIGSLFNPDWFALDTSRGYESPGSKAFLRATVIAFDLLIYVPSVVVFVRTWLAHRSSRTRAAALFTLLLQPSLILVDSGHFQYNSIMLGLTLQSLNFFHSGRDLLGAICFVASLCFKQMALYYSPAIFGYLLGKCFYIGGRKGFFLFVQIGLVTSLSFAIFFAPFLQSPPLLLQALTRIFPVARGIFEDKVANFWCASDVVLKWRRWLSTPTLVRMAAGATALSFMPSLYGLIRGGIAAGKQVRMHGADINITSSDTDQKAKDKSEKRHPKPGPAPTIALLLFALLNCSLSFFLFSFQVHEKSILLPLLPCTLLIVFGNPDAEGGGERQVWEWGVLMNNIGVFSMWPLLQRDGLALQYVTLTLLWNFVIGYNPMQLRPSLTKQFALLSYATAITLHILPLIISPPPRYPDLYPVLNVLLSGGVFASAWLWSMKRIVQVGWAMGLLGGNAEAEWNRRRGKIREKQG